MTGPQYRENGGRFDLAHIHRRLGSWNKALDKADIPVIRKVNLNENELFANLQRVWIQLGRQPRRKEMRRPISAYSARPYIARYGGWVQTLRRFLKWVQKPTEVDTRAAISLDDSLQKKHRRSPRTANDRLHFLVMRRDGFSCRTCGASPAKSPGVDLVLDHIVPWEKGGETTIDNLQTLCRRCNSGKSNLPMQDEA